MMFHTSQLPSEVRFREVCRRWQVHYGQSQLPTPPSDPAESLLKLLFVGSAPPPPTLRAWHRLWRHYPAAALAQGPDDWLAAGALPPANFRTLAEWLYGPPGLERLRLLAEASPQSARAWASTLPGISPALADQWLLLQFRQPLLPADATAVRVWSRLDWPLGLLPDWLMPTAAARFAFWQQTQRHAQRVCTARQPFCGRCPVADLCPWLARHPL